MFWRRKNRSRDQDLDRIGGVLLRAAALSEEEAHAAASSPFLYQRIRARIAEKERWIGGWMEILSAARLAVPAMALAAMAAVALLMLSVLPGKAENISGDPLRGSPELAIIPKVSSSACYMSIKEQCFLSSDEAIAILFNLNVQEDKK